MTNNRKALQNADFNSPGIVGLRTDFMVSLVTQMVPLFTVHTVGTRTTNTVVCAPSGNNCYRMERVYDLNIR